MTIGSIGIEYWTPQFFLKVSFFKTGLDIFGSIERIAPASARAQRVSTIVAWLRGLNPETLFASDIY